jgi:hypothetical protein
VVIKARNRQPTIIKVVLRVHNHGSEFLKKKAILIYNQGSQDVFKKSNNCPINCPFVQVLSMGCFSTHHKEISVVLPIVLVGQQKLTALYRFK